MKGRGESIGINIYQFGKMKKRAWKREVKLKIKKKYNKKLKENTETRTIQKEKWLMKKYIKNGNPYDVKLYWKLDYTCGMLKRTTQKMTQIQYAQLAETKRIQQSMC